jgi:hypothetical protein
VTADGSIQVLATPPEQTPQWSSGSCFWTRGKVRWCLDSWESEEWINSWEGSITQYEGESRYYVYNQKDEVLGYLRPATRGGWRAMVLTCVDNPPMAWSRQGCGYVRDGKAIPASRNVLHVYAKGRRIGTARGPGVVAVAAYKLVLGDSEEAAGAFPLLDGSIERCLVLGYEPPCGLELSVTKALGPLVRDGEYCCHDRPDRPAAE